MAEHRGIIECVQGDNESVGSWLERAMASAVKGAHEWKSKTTTRDRSTKEEKSEVTVLQVVPPLIDVESVWRSRKPDVDIRPLAAVRPMGPMQGTSDELREDRDSTQPSVSPEENPPPVRKCGDPWRPFFHSLSKTCALDGNANEHSSVLLDETGRQERRSVLPEGHIYDEDIGLPVDSTQEGADDDRSIVWTDNLSVVSVLSEPPSDDDGHSKCGKGGFHSCPDNPANFNLREYGDSDDTVVDVDVMNTNQRFSNSVSEGSGEDRFESCKSNEKKRSDSNNDRKP